METKDAIARLLDVKDMLGRAENREAIDYAVGQLRATLPEEKEEFPLAKCLIEAERKWCEQRGNSHYRPWESFDRTDRQCMEAGAAAVLKECAVQPEDVTKDDIQWLGKQVEVKPTANPYTVGDIYKELIRRIQARKGAA
jgi:hypothetical protein